MTHDRRALLAGLAALLPLVGPTAAPAMTQSAPAALVTSAAIATGWDNGSLTIAGADAAVDVRLARRIGQRASDEGCFALARQVVQPLFAADPALGTVTIGCATLAPDRAGGDRPALSTRIVVSRAKAGRIDWRGASLATLMDAVDSFTNPSPILLKR